MASSLDTPTTRFPYTSAQALTVVKPTRSPVKEPGPVATASRSASSILVLALANTSSTAGSSHAEYSEPSTCFFSAAVAPPNRTATLPRASHVSMAKLITMGNHFLYASLLLQSKCLVTKVSLPSERLSILGSKVPATVDRKKG